MTGIGRFGLLSLIAMAFWGVSTADACEAHEDLLDLRSHHGGVYLGETHGTTATAEIVDCFIDALIADGRTFVLSLEIHAQEDGPEASIAAASAFGAKGSGVLTPGLAVIARDLVAATGRGRFSAHDCVDDLPPALLAKPTETWGESEYAILNDRREACIAMSLDRDLASGDFVLAVGGSLHAASDVAVEGLAAPAASRMTRDIATVLLTSSAGGRARYCTLDGCDEREVGPRSIVHSASQSLASGSSQTSGFLRLYDFIYDVGPLQPIPDPGE